MADALDQLIQGNGQAPAIAAPAQAEDFDAQAANYAPKPEAQEDALDSLINQDKNSSLEEQLKGFGEGAASAATLGLSTGLERDAGVEAKDINRRRETGGHALGTAVGIVLPALVGDEAGLLGGAGSLMEGAGTAAEALVPGQGVLASGARGALNQATQMAILQGGDEISKRLSSDPNQTVSSAIHNIGTAALIGGGVGGALGSAGAGLKALGAKSGLGDFVADFKGKLQDAMTNPNPVEAVTKELQPYYAETKNAADEVYGASGLKSQDVGKLIPENLSPKMMTQANDIASTLDKKIQGLGEDPNARYLQKAADQYKQAVTSPDASPHDIFSATENLKKQMQELSSYKSAEIPLADRGVVTAARDISPLFRQALEDTSVWGKAAERQQSINKAFSEYLQPLKDFESRFTTKINGDRVIDPGKVNTYLNGLGKPSAELKQSMLDNFLKASEKYRNVIADTHANLGIESPLQPAALQATKSTLNDLTPGAKLAQVVINKGLAKLGGEALGSGIGGALGAAVGHPVLGAVAGEHMLGPFIESVLPSITKPILEKAASGEGFAAASALGQAAVKGQKILTNATNAVLKAAPSNYLEAAQATEKNKERLQAWVDKVNADPSVALNSANHVAHYLPDHGGQMSKVGATVATYLGQQKPKPATFGLLGGSQPPSKQQMTAYDRTLGIAEQPLSVLKNVHRGDLTQKDLQDLNSMHPDAYNAMKQEMTNAIINRHHSEAPIPYKARQSLSLFLGQPLDNTMQQPSIAAIQSLFAPTPPPGNPQQGSKGSTKALAKTSSMYETPGQAREKNRSQKA